VKELGKDLGNLTDYGIGRVKLSGEPPHNIHRPSVSQAVGFDDTVTHLFGDTNSNTNKKWVIQLNCSWKRNGFCVSCKKRSMRIMPMTISNMGASAHVLKNRFPNEKVKKIYDPISETREAASFATEPERQC
jgi:hypothetical protein